MSRSRTRETKLDVERFFKERKKAPENYFFSPDGKGLVARTKDGESTIPMKVAMRRTPDELNAAYQEKNERLAALEENHDKNIRALLDAHERGESDDVIMGLNRACQSSDSALFEEHWANKRMVSYASLEIRTVNLEQKREVRKFPTDVYVFEGRRVGLDYEYNIRAGELLDGSQTTEGAAERTEGTSARIVLLPSTAVAGRGDLIMVGPIEFSAKSEKYREFSSFYPAPISLEGKVYPTVEHYLQAMKFPGDIDYQELIRRSKDAMTAKKLGTISDPSRPIRPDWETIRDDIMRRGLDAKFRQNPELGLLLTETGNRTLTEVSTDIYWGVGKAKSGKNRLGQLLAELRAKLQTEQSTSGVGKTEVTGASVATASVPVVTAVPLSKLPPAPGKIRLKAKPAAASASAASASAASASAAPPSSDETSRSIIQSALSRVATIPRPTATLPAPEVPPALQSQPQAE